ncbi:methionine synthase [Nocardioides panaciterrulae]|uniref:Methionine synthase II (Cobalamin-independent) n=1 Tax=Nocardioides panaciterrulae TaxID=661492 RepID=A0A7Y9E7G2_9ACTN|nr:methionine synthase [Nocardioides panaciterrulae]NYD42539.1 methionine synthase II (cobalamin-independent) [Nocardioides panaciterrulae]
MTGATGVGSMPGDTQHAYAEAVRAVLGELGASGLPYLPEVPGRGAPAGMTGRALAVVSELGADLQPAGWRLTGNDGSGADHRRARSLLAQDLDGLEEQTQGYEGALKIQVTGPWTLATTVEKPRGDKVLSDRGARRELAQALAEGLREHVRDVRRRVPGVRRLVVQVDEPALSAVLAGSVPTASGFHRHRSVDLPEASATLAWVLEAVDGAGAEPWVHTCAAGTPLRLLRGAGARGLSVDLDLMSAADHDELAEALESGESVVLGVLPATDPADPPTDAAVTERVLRWLEMLGLDPATTGDSLLLSPACGLAGASTAWSRRALALVRAAAGHLSD